MAFSASVSTESSDRFHWMWLSSSNPFSPSDTGEWRWYSHIENRIIEKAYKAGATHAILDDYHIDLKHKVQISNYDINKQRPVRRMAGKNADHHIREERFLPNPVAPTRPFGGQYGFISPFIKEVAKYLNLTKEQLPSKNETIVPMIVERAAVGIIEEGVKIGKKREAEEIATVLRETKEKGIKEVWNCCAYLYSLESFLYKKVNEVMRLIGSEEHEQVWRSKVRTFGPFCLLLWDNPNNSKINKPGTILYRGSALKPAEIAMYANDCSQEPKPLRSFQAFTSSSRNRSVAEQFGNVLFIMKTRIAFTFDLSPLSQYPGEEEELISPGVSFTIDEVKFDNDKNKTLIYLTLQQRHNMSDKHQLAKTLTRTTSNTDYIRIHDHSYAVDRDRYAAAADRFYSERLARYADADTDDDFDLYDCRDGDDYDWK